VPLLVSALLAGVLRFAGRATMGPRLSAAGVGLGILATYGLAMGVPPLPPVISLEKIAYVTAAGLILGVLIDLTRVAPFARWFAFAALLAAALYWLAEPRADLNHPWRLAGLVALWIIGLVTLWRAEAGRDGGMEPVIKLLVAAIGVGLVAMIGNADVQAKLAFATAAALVGFLVWNWPQTRYPWNAALLLGAQVTLLGLIANLSLFSAASLPALAILILVFFADVALRHINLGTSKFARSMHPWVLGALCLLPVLAAIAVAQLHTSTAG